VGVTLGVGFRHSDWEWELHSELDFDSDWDWELHSELDRHSDWEWELHSEWELELDRHSDWEWEGVTLGVGVDTRSGSDNSEGVTLGVGVGVTLGVGVGVGGGSIASSVENTILPTRIERGNDCDVMLDCPVVIAPAVPLLAAFPTTNG
jgi:hypothetical protein